MSDKPRSANLPCDCDQGLFDCEGRIRAHLAGNGEAGDELASKFFRLMQAVVAKRIYEERRQDRDDCFQALMEKVFGKTRDRTVLGKMEAGRWRLQDWINRTNRGPFCRWIISVAAKHVIDWNSKPLGPYVAPIDNNAPVAPPIESDSEPGPLAAISEFLGQSTPQLQKLYRLRIEQKMEWPDVALELGVRERTAHYWWKELKRGFLRTLIQQGFDDILLPSIRALLKEPSNEKAHSPKAGLVDDVDDSHNLIKS